MTFRRFDVLSKSASGLSYVRERRLGVTRVLTPSELEDFNDPPQCIECGEQFGCEHFNCAGEPLLNENEIESEVPRQWMSFAKDYGIKTAGVMVEVPSYGISRGDLIRLGRIERSEGEYRVADHDAADMRTQELMLLLNDAR